MNKKILVWFCGTDTGVAPMVQLFADYIPDHAAALFIDGIGSPEQKREAETMSPASYWERLVNYIGKRFKTDGGNIKDSIAGYQEKHQLAQDYDVRLFLDDYFIDEQVGGIDLVIGGHSRGAAAGMVGFLSDLCAAVQHDEHAGQSPFFRKVKKITLIPVDPVAGTFGNDILQSKEAPVPIAQMLHTIQARTGNPDLFHIISLNARFDARNPFGLDDKWQDFFKAVKDGDTLFGPDKARFLVAGFRHSAMVFPEDEITELYTGTYSPTALLQHIVTGCLQAEDHRARIDEIAQEVHRTELAAIDVLKHLTARTTWSSYSPALPGTSLQSVIKTASDKKEVPEYGGRTLLTKEEWNAL